MVKSRHAFFAAIALIAISSGCNGGITNPQQQLNAGALSVDFPDGTELLVQSGTTYSISSDGSSYVIDATDNLSDANAGDEVTLTIPFQKNIDGTVTVPFTVSAPTDVAAQVTYYDNGNSESPLQFYGNSGQGSCSITITQTSPTLMGTFSALEVSANPADTISLRNGAFNATQ